MRTDRERREQRNLARPRKRIGERSETLHQANRMRLNTVDDASSKQQVPCNAATTQLDNPGNGGLIDGDTKLRRRDAESCRWRCNPEIGEGRHLHAGTESVAFDRSNRHERGFCEQSKRAT